MWKQREEPPKPTSVPASPVQHRPIRCRLRPIRRRHVPLIDVDCCSRTETEGEGDRTYARGTGEHWESIIINGELSGSEDLTIEGRVDGKIELRDTC